MGIIIVDGFDQCERPNCPEDITLRFVSVPSSICHLESASVAWVIEGTNDTPDSMEVYYSLNSSAVNNSVVSAPDDGVYSPGDYLYSLIPAPLASGVLSIQARAVINGVIYRSDPLDTIIVNECDSRCFPEWKFDPVAGEDVTDVYIEYGTWWVPDDITVFGSYDPLTCTGDELYRTQCVSTLHQTTKYPDAYPPSDPKFGNPNVQLYPDNQAIKLNEMTA